MPRLPARLVAPLAALVLVASATGCATAGPAPGAPTATAPKTTPAPAPAAPGGEPRSVVFVTPAPLASSAYLRRAVADVRQTMLARGGTLLVAESSTARTVAANVETALAARPDLIVGLGDAVLDDFDLASAANLDQQFLLLDSSPDEPTVNFTSARFRDYEADYLLGVEAGLVTTTGTIGLVTPEDDPLVDAQTKPFVAGAKAASARVRAVVADLGGSERASAATRAREVAAELHEGGADVVLATGFETPMDLAPAAAAAGFETFGFDVDRCDGSGSGSRLLDGTVKNIRIAFEASLALIAQGHGGGVSSYGLAEGGVGLLSSAETGDAPTPDCGIARHPGLAEAVHLAQRNIVDGRVTVADPRFAVG
jgi:basic membrane protein A